MGVALNLEIIFGSMTIFSNIVSPEHEKSFQPVYLPQFLSSLCYDLIIEVFTSLVRFISRYFLCYCEWRW
jgi:hypothetical protein